MPTPRPLTSVTRAAVEKPGRKMRSSTAVSSMAASSSSVASCFSSALSRSRAGLDAGAVVAHLDDDLVAAVARAQRDHALVGLAGGAARGGQLDAVVDGVAHEVQQRVVELLDEHLVELGVAADDAPGARACRAQFDSSRTVRWYLVKTRAIGSMRSFMTCWRSSAET